MDIMGIRKGQLAAERGGGQRSRRERESRVGTDDGEIMIWQKNRRRFGGGMTGWRYKAAHNPLGTVPNAPLSSAPGK